MAEASSPLSPETYLDIIHRDLNAESHNILMSFNRGKSNRAKGPKKEYIRIKVIRGHKRAIRQLSTNKIPRKTLHGFLPFDESAESGWNGLKHCYLKYSLALNSSSLTEKGPITDGKSKRSTQHELSSAKSFNNQFCKEYFTPMFVRETFYFYVELLFVGRSPEVLQNKFDMHCCSHDEHLIGCELKWMRLKYYFNTVMLQELGLEPWKPHVLPSMYFAVPKREETFVVPRFISQVTQTAPTSENFSHSG